MEIRLINKEEIKTCHKLIVDSFLPVAEQLLMTEGNCPGNSAYLKIEKLFDMHNKGLNIFGLYDDELIGCIALEKKSEKKYKIKLLSVIPCRRRDGLGRKLMEAVEKEVISLGGSKVQLGMIYENELLRKWYLHLGYKLDKVKPYKGNDFKIAYMVKDL